MHSPILNDRQRQTWIIEKNTRIIHNLQRRGRDLRTKQLHMSGKLTTGQTESNVLCYFWKCVQVCVCVLIKKRIGHFSSTIILSKLFTPLINLKFIVRGCTVIRCLIDIYKLVAHVLEYPTWNRSLQLDYSHCIIFKRVFGLRW